MKAEEGAKLHARCHFNIDYATLSFSAKSLAKLMYAAPDPAVRSSQDLSLAMQSINPNVHRGAL